MKPAAHKHPKSRPSLASRVAALAIFCIYSSSVLHGGIITLSGTTYTQNFDGLGTGSPSGVTGGDLNLVATSLNGWFFSESGSGANTTITAGTGSSNSGDTYNFGAASGSDRALGGLRSGSVIPSWGFIFTNGTGQTITDIAITYLGETWRVGTASRSDRIDFQTLAGATSITSGSWADFNALDYANPGQTTPPVSGSVLHSATLSSTLTGLSIANGSSFGFRWTDFDASGSDDGMAIDDFSITFTLAAGNTDLFWLGADTTRGGGGTWQNSGGTAWSATDADGTGTAWDSSKTAVFNTAPATVTLSGTVDVARGISFAAGTDGSSISGGTSLNLTGATASNNTLSTAAGVTATISSDITGTANGLTKAGDGSLVLGGNNSFVGNVTISGGVLSIGADSQLGNTANDIVLGGTLRTTSTLSLASGRELTGAGTLDIAPGTTLTVNGNLTTTSLTFSNSGTADLLGTNSVGALSIAGNATIQGAAISLTGLTSSHSGTASIDNALNFSAGDKTISVSSGATLSLTGVQTAAGRIIKIGSGTLEVTEDNSTLANSFRLGIAGSSPSDGGTLRIGHQNSLGASAATFQFNYGTLEATTALTGTSAIPQILSLGGRTGTPVLISGSNTEFTGNIGFFRATGPTGEMVLNVNNTTTLSGNVVAIGGSGTTTGLTLGGSGKLTLTGNWTANDLPITLADSLDLITATTLDVPVTVGANATLGGTGTIGGATTIAGTHSPGTSPGIQTFSSDLTYAAGSNILWELVGNTTSGRGTNFDGINVGGTLTFTDSTALNLSFNSPGSTVDWTNILWSTSQTWDLFTFTGTAPNLSNLDIFTFNWADSNGALFNTVLPDSAFSLSQSGNIVQLNYAIIPEPSRLALLGLASGLLLLRRRRP